MPLTVGAESFAFEYPVVVQWGDVDRMGHVNNAIYARYLESARCAYFAELGLGDARSSAPGAHDGAAESGLSGEVGPIVARQAIDYRRALYHPDVVHVHVATTRLGRSSSVQRYVVTSEQQGGAVVAEGEVVWVLLHYREGKPVEIPAALRARIGALEAKAGRAIEGA